MTEATPSGVVSLSVALARANAVRAQGGKIVLANGAFDIVHVGHLRYLEAAAAAGSLLVVGVNSDRSVQKIKGPDRPYLPEHERAELIAGFRVVDLVVIFDEPDVGRLLQQLQPDFHAKGTDYTEDTVPEKDLVAAYGGRVIICGDPKDHATTDLASRIRGTTGPN